MQKPDISLDDLMRWHVTLKALKPAVGTEARKLLETIAACIGAWPKVRASKAEEIKRRWRVLHEPAARAETPQSLAQGWLDKDDLLPLVTDWYGRMVTGFPGGLIGPAVAHEMLLESLGLAKYKPQE